MKRKIIIGAVVLALGVVAFIVVRGNKATKNEDILATVKRGEFKMEIETTGELDAKNSVNIQGPSQLREFQVYQVTIQSIIAEGTVVKKGDWVATLDPSDFQNKYNEKQINLEKANSKFVQTQLDTTLTMRQARDELVNLRYAVEEKQIILDQSKFEPPATIKQNEINREKADRALEQALENYKIKKNQNIEKMREVSAELRKVQAETSNMSKVLGSFTVLAPEAGMIIYEKGWDGRAIKGGSQISVWDPTVATLPDLTKMLSKTYVNEVDVRKVKTGQKVEMGLDAFPDKKLTGVVTKVANVGDQRPNSDAKVFEVLVEIDGADLSLRPAMTTSNKIIAKVVKDASYVPLECLHSDFDSITYVIKKDGLKKWKQEVIVGETNANDAIILKGATKDETIFLSVPAGMENDEIVLLPELNGKRKKKKEEEKEEAPAVKPDVKKISVK